MSPHDLPNVMGVAMFAAIGAFLVGAAASDAHRNNQRASLGAFGTISVILTVLFVLLIGVTLGALVVVK